ncbi:hypothetical protein [Cesiribacter sp. SM1]|uniref:hypothetical protein n=1 Tax=Cesiribacter sp. SM1 TaxID=2861196 RepID=UPI001CD3B9D9|nr:hypothetical protein [Cesiribacter sp. SM1]
MRNYLHFPTFKRYVFTAFLILLVVPAFSQDGEQKVKRLHLTVGAMLRSPELIDHSMTSVYSYAVVAQIKAGGNLGIMYKLRPELSIGYNANLRYGLVYYKDGYLTRPVKEFITDHSIMASYRISDADSKFGLSLGLGHTWLFTNKSYTVQSVNGFSFPHNLDYGTFDVVTSFSYNNFHAEHKLMFNYDQKYPLDVGEKDLRMWLNLRVYYAFGVF